MDVPSPLTATLSRWIEGQTRAPLPLQVQLHIRRSILDHLGAVVASSVGQTSAAVAVHARRHYGPGRATALGFGKTSPLGAALVNGTSAHGIETDDGYTPGSFHPGSVILPAVFALAQERGMCSEQVLRAAAIGMEVSCRIAAAGHPGTRRRHFHNTPLAGVFGAAAASAALLGLDADGIASALGIAGSHASGLFEFLNQPSEVKRLHPGKAARDGIASADLAEAGLTGPATVLEGRDGYFAAYAGQEETDSSAGTVLSGLGDEWVVLDTYIKPYPCCRHLHGAIDAALALRQRHGVDWADVEHVHVGTYSIAARHDRAEVETMMGAQLSIPFALSVALLKGSVALEDFAPESRQDPDLDTLMRLVTVETDERAQADYPHRGRPAEVTVTLRDGRRLACRVEQPYGEKDNPMSDADLEQKVRRLVEPVIGPEGAALLIAAAWDFEELGFLDGIDRRIREARPVPRPSHR